MNVTDLLIDEIYNLRNIKITEKLEHQVKRCLLDYLGATFIGSKLIKNKGDILLENSESLNGASTVIGFNKKASIERSVFVNGISSHFAEMDDGVRFGMLHPGSPIFSALLPVFEQENISWDKFVLGVIAGYEASVRVAMAIKPSHYNEGYHPTSTCGNIGASIGLSTLFDLPKAQMKTALSSAILSTAGSLKVIEDESELKPFNVGRAALDGFVAVLLAKAGFKSPDDVFSGKTGFINLMAKKFDLSYLKRKKNDSFCIEKVYFKSYAACRHAHPSIEAVIRIMTENDLKVNDIHKIIVKTYSSIIGMHDYKVVKNVSSAKMSVPYSIAVAIVTGRAGIEEFTDEFIKDSVINSIMNKVEIYADEEISAKVPDIRAAVVSIQMTDDKIYTERVDFPKGEPENPLSDEELIEKFKTLALLSGKTEEEINKILEIIFNSKNNMDNFFTLL